MRIFGRRVRFVERTISIAFCRLILNSGVMVCHPSNAKYSELNAEDHCMNDKWTIRRVSGDARAMIEEVHGLTGIPYGRLVSEAIRVWFDLLDQQSSATLATRLHTR